MTRPIHATSVARRTSGGWAGVLLTGPSGAGKSDMALRLIALGWRLVADDYSRVWASGDAVWAAPPDTLPAGLAGHIEARGLGIIKAGASRPLVRIYLVAVCGRYAVERLPEPGFEVVAGLPLPRLSLDARPASAPRVLEHALERVLETNAAGRTTLAV